MKKTIFSITMTLLLLLILGYVLAPNLLQLPNRRTKSWQTIAILGIGTFRIPEEWYAEQRDGFLLITDRPLNEGDYTVYIVGTFVNTPQPVSHTIFEGVERQGSMLRSQGFSNHGGLRWYGYAVDGITEVFYSISLTNGFGGNVAWFDLFVWNREAVSERCAAQIAKTFRADRENYNHPNIGQTKYEGQQG